MHRKKWMITLTSSMLIGGMLFGMTGCQLAEDKQTESGQESTQTMENEGSRKRLCGAFATYGKLNDAEENLMAYHMVKNPNNVQQNKIFAKKEGNGYSFEGLNGSYIANYLVKEKNPQDNYRNTIIFGQLQDTHTEINVTDPEGQDTVYTNISAKLKAVSKKGEYAFSIYPVYLDEQDQMYIDLSGKETSVVDHNIAGASMNQTLNETYTEKKDGIVKKYGMKTEITVEQVDELEYVVVKEMNAKDKVLRTKKYKKTDFASYTDEDGAQKYKEQKLELVKDTAYILVERHVVTGENKKDIVREIVQLDANNPDDNQITCDFPENNGLVMTRIIQVHQ